MEEKVGGRLTNLDCNSSLMFVEDVFSLVTLQIYPCNSGRIFKT
jgi:hypothetical protein